MVRMASRIRRASLGSWLATVALALTGVTITSSGCGDDDDEGGNPAGVGNHCDSNDDCRAGAECYLGPGGGYCTTPCDLEGDTSACPADTVCKPIQGGPRRCLLICGSDSTCPEPPCQERYCPSGSSCTDISGTDLTACEPNP